MAVAEATNPETSIVAKATNWIQQARDYIDDLKKEMRMVSWPTRDQVVSTTVVVIVAVFAFALYFWAVDQAIGRAITKLFDSLAK